MEISINITPADFSTVERENLLAIQLPNSTPSKLVVINAAAEPRNTTTGE